MMTLVEVQQLASRRYEDLNIAGRINRDSFIAGFVDCWRISSGQVSEANNTSVIVPDNGTIIEAEIEGIKANKINWQLIQIETNFTDEQIENELNIFKLQCLAENTIHETVVEAARHFRMWINKRKTLNRSSINVSNGTTSNKGRNIDEWRKNIADDIFRHFGG